MRFTRTFRDITRTFGISAFRQDFRAGILPEILLKLLAGRSTHLSADFFFQKFYSGFLPRNSFWDFSYSSSWDCFRSLSRIFILRSTRFSPGVLDGNAMHIFSKFLPGFIPVSSLIQPGFSSRENSFFFRAFSPEVDPFSEFHFEVFRIFFIKVPAGIFTILPVFFVGFY